LRVDTFCSSGPGGQSVNPTYRRRITHIPSGLVVSHSRTKNRQIKNRAKAHRVLRARLYEQEQEKRQAALPSNGAGKSKRRPLRKNFRTYHFPQNLVTDHRIGLTAPQLTDVNGRQAGTPCGRLVSHYESERLQQESLAPDRTDNLVTFRHQANGQARMPLRHNTYRHGHPHRH